MLPMDTTIMCVSSRDKRFYAANGDPTGTGRGGQSIWGGNFQDEIVRNLKHDKPGVLSANSGANTNGSQFYYRVAATPWLDGKHTVFDVSSVA